MPDKRFNVKPLLELQKLTRKAALKRFSATEADFQKDVRYERATNVDRLSSAETAPAALYFSGDELVAALITGEALAQGDEEGIRRELGPAPSELASRAGKTSTLYVYAERGFAYSGDGESIDFIEVFQPTTIENYTREIYEDPGPFVR